MQPRRTFNDDKFIRNKTINNSEQRRSISNFGRPPRVDCQEMSRAIANALEKLPSLQSNRRYSMATVAFKPNQRVLIDTQATFLRQFDGRFDSSCLQTDLIPDIYKTLGYYNPINKNLFNPVGAPHTWNSCLSIMSWLAAVCMYHYQQRMSNDTAKRQSKPPQPTIEDCVLDCCGKDTTDLSVIDVMIRKEREELTTSIQRYTFDKDSAELATRNLNDSQPDNSIIRERLEQLKKQLFREKQENKSIENQTQQKNRETKEKQSQIEDVKQNISQVNGEISRTQELLKRQELSVGQANRINMEIADFQQKQRSQRQRFMTYSDRYAEATNKLHYKFIQLQNFISELNRILDDSQLRSRNLQYALQPIDLAHLSDYLSDSSSRGCQSLQRLRNSEIDRTNAYCLRLAEYVAVQKTKLAVALKKCQEQEVEVTESLRKQVVLKKELHSEEVGLQESNRCRQSEADARRNRVEESSIDKAALEKKIELVKEAREKLEAEIGEKLTQMEHASIYLQKLKKQVADFGQLLLQKADNFTRALYGKIENQYAIMKNLNACLLEMYPNEFKN